LKTYCTARAVVCICTVGSIKALINTNNAADIHVIKMIVSHLQSARLSSTLVVNTPSMFANV